jgi:alginate O-acetyltransferase complex protein AlgI
MLFPTLSFAVFFAIVLPASWLLMPHRVRWRLFMVGASWFFYGVADWRFVGLLAGSTVVNHLFARQIYRSSGRTRSTWTAVTVTANLAVLGWFKYIGLLALSGQSILDLIGLPGKLPLPEVALPVGISFFTFQALSYVIDTGRGKVRPASMLDFAVYLSFFPHLVAGPIVRASEFLPQIRRRIDPRKVDAARAFWLISLGLFKKVVIASYLASKAADPLFGFPHQHGGVEALFGVYAYAIQIYADFSGYTDIAIGLALLLGIQFPQNFNAPYAAASLQDFWRRWHMTLSRWLRDYLYIPLGGSRRSSKRTYINVMITMLLGGLWHGAAWTFVAWGGLHGAGLAGERWVTEHRGRRGRDVAAGDTLAEAAAGEAAAGEAAAGEAAAGEAAAGEAAAPVPAGSVNGLAPAPGPARQAAPVFAASTTGDAAGRPSRQSPDRPNAAGRPVRAAGRPAAAVAAVAAVGPTPQKGPDAGANPFMLWTGRLLTFHLVCLGWIFFRATSFHNALDVISRILWGHGQARLNPLVVATVVGALVMQLVPGTWAKRLLARFSQWSIWAQSGALAAGFIVIDLLGPAGVAPFIYFRF